VLQSAEVPEPHSAKCLENFMAFDPTGAFSKYADAQCSVQLWTADDEVAVLPSLKAGVVYARENGAGWKEVEITVHMPREDIVYATGKVRSLIEHLSKSGE
jgi:hypothetical protein